MPEENIQEVKPEENNIAKKQLTWTKVIAGFMIGIFALFVAAFCLVIPRTMKVLDIAVEELEEASYMVEEAEEAMENINKIDFDALSESVTHLTTVINGIANIFK